MPLPQPHIRRSHRARRRSRPPATVPAVAAAVVSFIVVARAGALSHIWDFLDFGAGVLSLVSLTATVLWGLLATDRALLGPGHRLLAQGAHRGLAVAGLSFLALHIWVKVAEQQASAAAAVVPFADEEQPVLIGFGTLAGYLFVSVAVSGAVRSVFATKARSLWWRALHFGAYPAWGASLVHGLKSGRPGGTWVTVSYGLCLIGVAGVLLLRVKSRASGEPSSPAAAPGPRVRPRPGPRAATVREARPLASTGPAPLSRPSSPSRAYATASTPGRAGGGRQLYGEQPAGAERWL
ncbi:hypothetical protein OG429_32880 [Streptomyces sp. NBC_00190]|uniref:hypothetical protein n=1 Tax=unclassified Streptomyces TaxID=2593676 RepID=UPI002E2D7519|nr:hypothetical protein [Streptomyces sp. NBC_00190]WSZ43649.1 hypothetical protein OG239_35340 [Streptomyces sp. NBC_00868]